MLPSEEEDCEWGTKGKNAAVTSHVDTFSPFHLIYTSMGRNIMVMRIEFIRSVLLNKANDSLLPECITYSINPIIETKPISL